MTDEFMNKLNISLITSYRSILKIEEQFARRAGSPNVSASEMHMIDVIGKGENNSRTVKEIANALHITQPSVTAAINRLEKKGCVERIRSKDDGRVVYIHLTRFGHKIYSLFLRFHENMVRSVAKELTDEEKAHLLKGMIRLNEFFAKQFQDDDTDNLSQKFKDMNE